MVQWADFPLSGKMNTSNDDAILSRAMAAIENAYPNDAGGHSRFPGMEYHAQFPGTRTYLFNYRDQLFAGTDLGRLWRISRNGEAVDVTGVPISGGNRWTFTNNEQSLVMAAGGPIIQLAGDKTTLLSRDAPNTTHVGFLDGYMLALENGSARFFNSNVDAPEAWDPQNFNSANAQAEEAKFLIVTPYRELMVGGANHIEQWETLKNGDQAFDRRWSTGQGCAYPYTLVSDSTGTYGVNARKQFVRFAGQVSQDQGADVQLSLSKVDDWTEAWAGELTMFSSRFMVIQCPNATNPYGSKGLTFCYDYRNQKFMFLYGPVRNGLPTRWPGWSFAHCYDKVFVGVPGGVAYFDDDCYQNLGEDQRVLLRTPHVDKFGASRIDNVRLRLKRGFAQGPSPLRREAGAPYQREVYSPLNREAGPNQGGVIGIRCNPDNRGFDEWQIHPIGDAGENSLILDLGHQGCANTWQFEIMCSDALPLEISEMKVWVERLEW